MLIFGDIMTSSKIVLEVIIVIFGEQCPLYSVLFLFRGLLTRKIWVLEGIRLPKNIFPGFFCEEFMSFMGHHIEVGTLCPRYTFIYLIYYLPQMAKIAIELSTMVRIILRLPYQKWYKMLLNYRTSISNNRLKQNSWLLTKKIPDHISMLLFYVIFLFVGTLQHLCINDNRRM